MVLADIGPDDSGLFFACGGARTYLRRVGFDMPASGFDQLLDEIIELHGQDHRLGD